MTWHAAEMPNDALDPDYLVGRLLKADKPKGGPPEFLLVYQCLPGEAEITGPEVRAIPPEPLPLCLWQILAPVLDEYILEALRAADDPDAEQEAEYPACRQEVSGVIEALRDWLLPEEPCPDPRSEQILEAPWCEKSGTYYAWRDRQRLRAQLTEQARIAREQ